MQRSRLFSLIRHKHMHPISTVKRVFTNALHPLWRRFWRLIEQRVTPLEQRIDALEERINTVNAKIDTLDLRISSDTRLDNTVRTLPAYGQSILKLKKDLQEIKNTALHQ